MGAPLPFKEKRSYNKHYTPDERMQLNLAAANCNAATNDNSRNVRRKTNKQTQRHAAQAPAEAETHVTRHGDVTQRE